MTIHQNLIGLAAGVVLWLFGYWREKRRKLGDVPMIPPFYIQFLALLIVLITIANLIALITGVNWKAPQTF